MVRGFPYKPRPISPEPEFSNITIKTKTLKRLKFFGNNETFDELLMKLMDVAEGKCRRDTVAKAKQWLRERSEYRSLFLSS
jgi:hypothetical protein